MAKRPASHAQAHPPDPTELDESRRAAWLQSPYSTSVWTITDTADQGRTAQIDFNYRLSDGRNLSEASRLHATVKEYAWWLRDPRYTRIDDAHTHSTMVQNLMHLAHALSLRNIWSFAHLQPFDVEQLVEECRYGADAVLRASDRVEAYLQSLREINANRPRPFGGLPQYIIPSTGARTTTIYVDPIVVACGLPSGAKGLPRVAALIAREANENGLKTRSGKNAKSLEPLQNVTVQSLQRWLDPIEHLYTMRRQLSADGLTFRPFPEGAARVAAVKGIGTQRTPSPPPALALHLLEQSALWILNHRQVSSTKTPDISLDFSACWILVAAFTARRAEEINDLQANCLQGDDNSGWWLHIYIEKTLQRKEWIPVPGLVAKAVQTLTRRSAPARKRTGTDHLFQWLTPKGDVRRFNAAFQIEKFAKNAGSHQYTTHNGTTAGWHWHPHQFRRFFAILYFYRFEDATIEALSHHLRHFNLEMTRGYVTQDPEAAALWTDVEWGYMSHVARTVVSGERVVSGPAGEHVKRVARRLIDGFRRKLQVVSAERIGSSLSAIMKRRGMVLRPKAWVTCTCPNTIDAGSIAACRRLSGAQVSEAGPDFSAAGPTVCASCPHAMLEGKRKGFVDAEIGHLEAVAQASPRDQTLFGELEAARLLELADVKLNRYDQAEPLNDPAPDRGRKS